MATDRRRWVRYVAAVVAVLACGFAYLWFTRPRPAPLAREIAEALTLKTVVELYLGQNGDCPSLEQLHGWMPLQRTNDAWGTGFRWTCSSSAGVTVTSAGPDRRFESADDLSTDDEGRWPRP